MNATWSIVLTLEGACFVPGEVDLYRELAAGILGLSESNLLLVVSADRLEVTVRNDPL